MFEVRWVECDGRMQLQFRFRTLACDASGAFCAVSELSEWQAVRIIHSPDGSAMCQVVDVFSTDPETA